MLVPIYLFWCWPLLIVAAIVGNIYLREGRLEKRIQPGHRFAAYVLGVFSVAALIFFMLISFSGGAGPLIRNDGRIVGHVPNGYHLLNWRLSFDLRSYDVRESHPIDCGNSVTFLVKDPIVRRLKYSLTVEIGKSERDYATVVAEFGQLENGQLGVKAYQCVDRLTYDFNVTNAEPLKWFFNPEEPTQQAEFSRIVHAALDRPLAVHGLRLTAASFKVE